MTFKDLMRVWSDQVPRILRDAIAIIAAVILSSSLRTLLPIGEPVVVSPGLSLLAWMVLLGIALAGSFLIHKAKASARIKIASYFLLTIIAVTAVYFVSLNRAPVTSRAFFGYLIPLMWLGFLLARNRELFPWQAAVSIFEDQAHPNARDTKEDPMAIGRIVRDPASLFSLLALLIGTIFSIAIPYGAGFDEERHMVRIYDLANGYILPNSNPPNFTATVTRGEFFDLSYQRRFTQTPAFDMFAPETFLRKFSQEPSDRRYGVVTGSTYSPVIFLPQAILGSVLWRGFDFPVLPVIMLMRLAGLLLYVLGGWFAIRLLPVGKWAMAVLALAPMAMFQATTLNADGFNNAASFLFIAASLSVYAQPPEKLELRHAWMLAGSALLLGVAKPGAIVLLPLWLIFLTKKFPARKWLVILVLSAALAIGLNAGWMALALPHSNLGSGGLDRIARSVSLSIARPADFLSSVLGVLGLFGEYAKDWIAAYGYQARDVPAPVFGFYVVLLAAAVSVKSSGEVPIGRKERIMLGSLFLLYSAMWTAFYVLPVTGWQPRYFIAFAPLLFLALSGLVQLKGGSKPIVSIAGILCFLGATGFYSFGMYTTYYTHCDYGAYVGGPCTLPIYKNLEKGDLPELDLNAVGMVSQTFTSECNGLQEVSIFVKSNPAGGEGLVGFSLFDQGNHLLANATITANEIPEFAYLALPVSPPTGARNSTFRVQLEALDSALTHPIGLGIIERGFHDGDLIAGGELLEGDLLFHYTCVRP